MAWVTNGKMTKKLLNKTSRVYLLFSALILIAAAPISYFVTEQLYIDDADEALILRKNEFLQSYSSRLKQSDIPVWNDFNRDIKIEPAKGVREDVLFYTHYYDTLSVENEPYRELNAPVFIEGKPYTFVARINLVETEDLIRSIALLFFAIILFLLIGLYVITRKLSYHLWKPFYKTLEQIEQFDIDKSSQPQLSKTNIEEFDRLNQSIEKLIRRNISIYRSQREFVENAAHELQTPIAVFQAKIDMLIQGSDVTKEQSEILSSLNDSASRLNRLNKNLLLLSKIENDSFSDKREISFKELIEKNLAFFSEQAIPKNLSIVFDPSDNFKTKSNPVLAEILISNLFLNSIRHNIVDGEIHIQLMEQSVTFSNTGPSNPLNTEKLFNRFSKSDPSSQGSGLGLAIIKTIANLNQWKIKYDFIDNLHSFSVSIPKF